MITSKINYSKNSMLPHLVLQESPKPRATGLKNGNSKILIFLLGDDVCTIFRII